MTARADRLQELLFEIGFAARTFLRALEVATMRSSTPPLRAFYTDLRTRGVTPLSQLSNVTEGVELGHGVEHLLEVGNIATRAVMPTGDRAILSRCRELVGDLEGRLSRALAALATVPSGAALLEALRAVEPTVADLRRRLAVQPRP